ncbi:uncharacterized protein LOC131932252 [Physella acuta]|uniref:uncharacterized protein LOC131932252 n=1 Tax=Physella acuta TaxID=109671 RepID=UPI0027DAF642|nr:uncharacterized protein LOC131932252 [Physella acuta]
MEQHFPEQNDLNSEESVSPNLNTEPQPEEKNSAASFAVRVKNTENLNKDHVIRYPSQITRKTEALTLTPGVVRSPLSLVENSRRTMSHRNNIMSGGGKQLMKYSGIVDKENVFH